MKLALEALKRMKGYGNTFAYRSHEQNPHEQVCDAITALEALAEQDVQYTGNGTAGREADVRPTGFFFQSHRQAQQESDA